MCGIVAYTGKLDAKSFLLDGLARLEYRGYDSAGIALVDNGSLSIVRRKGKVAELRTAVGEQGIEGTCGIGHTRWATHGVPSEANAHPHSDCTSKIAIVHNGIIENHAELRANLEAAGHKFKSQTDSEVVAHLIEECYNSLGAANAPEQGPARLLSAVREAVAQLSGSFALAIVHADHPNEIVCVRNDSPLVIGSCKDGAMAASDTPAIIEHTRDVIYPKDRDIVLLNQDGTLQCYDPAGTQYSPTTVRIEWSLEDAERGGYADFMLKEINEQPRVIRDTLAGRFDDKTGELIFDELPFTSEEFKAIDRICIVACGTSYHAGLIGKDLLEGWARLPVEVAVASEFRYRNPIITPNTLVIAISQSGETADTLEAIKLARKSGAHVTAITNVVGSRITLEANTILFIKAHLEIAVAATKSFLAQVALLTLLALHIAQQRGQISADEVKAVYDDMQKLPGQIEEILRDGAIEAVERCAKEAVDADTALFIGRGVGATTCYEGALKLKEISYLHAEAFCAGEIKHGPIALIDPEAQTPVIAVALQSATYDKMVANIEEVLARGAKVIALVTKGDTRVAQLTPYTIPIPKTREVLSPILASVPLQLFARFIAIARGADVDQPRNLAKSVTVE
ncbi:MAG: glutamine--fructose-6-phosphate transaminase (isomerizing) [Coriobacteriales bacterium]|nr:glutamine--fructose-6-phosphate transaminase (isomerizing) [Coriobacteriales bacterium]